MTTQTSIVGSLGLCLVLAYACSPPKQTGDDTGGTGGLFGAGGAASAGSGGGAVAPGAGGVDTSTGGGIIDIPGVVGSGGGEATDASCAGLYLEPEAITVTKETQIKYDCTSDSPQPLALYLVLDNSGSMRDANKWTDAVSAITTFVNTDPTQPAQPWVCKDKDGNVVPTPADVQPPDGAGTISVAIQYFHPVPASNDECSGAAHRVAAVDMGVIPANAPAIIQSLASTGPNNNTPTVGALIGGTQYCADYQARFPDKKCVVVLITDGQPNGCNLTERCGNGNQNMSCVDARAEGVLTPIAASAFQAQSSVMTFTVGMGGVTPEGFALLDKIAIAGGSDCSPNVPGAEACNVSVGGSQAFLDALNNIRKSVQLTGSSSQTVTSTETQTSTVECEWSIPKPSDDTLTFDKDQVNIALTLGGVENKLGRVDDLAACDVTGGGWYYDDVNAPTKFVTCPTTCQAIKSFPDAKVNVQVGCATEVAVPR